MARRDNRSPSPAGSTHSSRRTRRDDDRYGRDRRDDGRSYRHRSRSRSLDRWQDRDSRRRRDRSIDNSYRPNRRERSRERRRSRERSPVRDRRNRSRDRYYRDRRDESRDHDRRRRDGSTDSRRRARRDDSKERTRDAAAAVKAEASITPTIADEERKREERRARTEAYKAQKQKELEALSGARLLEKLDHKIHTTQSSPATGSPIKASENASPAPKPASPVPTSPATYTGKFDPKAVMKKATAGSSGVPNALGGDFIPTNVKAPSDDSKLGPGVSAPTTAPTIAPTRPFKAGGNVSGFGLGAKASQDTEKPGNKRMLDFGDEETSKKKLEKLPSLPDAAPGSTSPPHDEGQEEDVDMAEGGTEEEVAAAARAAAEMRGQRAETNTTAPLLVGAFMGTSAQSLEADEEIDPLDAFMSGLTESSRLETTKGKTQGSQVVFGDDDEPTMEAVGLGGDDAQIKKKAKPEIPVIDHSKMEYEPFRKAFYVPPEELRNLSEDELFELRMSMDGIKVKGKSVPAPITQWAQCGLGVQTMQVLRSLGFERPTAIQAQAIPAIMSGRDVIGVAKTGSGKTLAFLLPMFRHIKDQRPLAAMEGPIGVILSPTRELATQIYRECKPYLKALDLRAVCAYGGTPIKDQIGELKRGAEILVCTPGRMHDLLKSNRGRVLSMARVTYVVLDEADRMFDMGFEPQVTRVLQNIRPGRQVVLFSATFPRSMETLARKALVNPVEIIVGGRSRVAPEITQKIEIVDEDKKFIKLLEILGEFDEAHPDALALIFVDRQDSADDLLSKLMKKGYPCNSIHGAKDQVDRDSAIQDFKKGDLRILIATSVAARGLDVKQLKLVVNYDVPNHLEDYVHRAGRTGRAGQTGTAVTFITPGEGRFAGDIVKALKQSEQEPPEALVKLAEEFQAQVDEGKAKKFRRGFGGRGQDHMQEETDKRLARERRQFKSEFKTGDDDEDEKEEEEIDLTPKVVAQGVPVVSSSTAPKTPALPGFGDIVVRKTETVDSSSNTGQAPMDKVRLAASVITGRLGKRNLIHSGQSIDNKGPDAGAFHSTLEINDFPQRARWAVTNRTNVSKILESTGCSITNKGTYYAPGTQPGPNDEPKLYILVEGDTELVVTEAMTELVRLLHAGMAQAAESESRGPTGKYSVV